MIPKLVKGRNIARNWGNEKQSFMKLQRWLENIKFHRKR